MKEKLIMQKILFSRDSECIQPIRELIEKQKHRTLVLWALDCTPPFLEIFEEKYPHEKRPRDMIEIAKAWARGDVKMPVAKKAIHATHNAATAAEDNPAAQAAARAIGHAAATIHVETHALGLVFYGLTALVYSADPKCKDIVVVQGCQWFYDRLLYWETNVDKVEMTWASFLMRENVPNKEKLLREKMQKKA